MADVFVSYKSGEDDVVLPLIAAIKGAGYSVWWDREISPSAPWEDTIERELELARVAVVAWSPNAVASENVRAEARRAKEDNKLVQVFLRPCKAPLFFGERQAVSLVDWDGALSDPRCAQLIQYVRTIVGPPAGEAGSSDAFAIDERVLGGFVGATDQGFSILTTGCLSQLDRMSLMGRLDVRAEGRARLQRGWLVVPTHFNDCKVWVVAAYRSARDSKLRAGFASAGVAYSELDRARHGFLPAARAAASLQRKFETACVDVNTERVDFSRAVAILPPLGDEGFEGRVDRSRSTRVRSLSQEPTPDEMAFVAAQLLGSQFRQRIWTDGFNLNADHESVDVELSS